MKEQLFNFLSICLLFVAVVVAPATKYAVLMLKEALMKAKVCLLLRGNQSFGANWNVFAGNCQYTLFR